MAIFCKLSVEQQIRAFLKTQEVLPTALALSCQVCRTSFEDQKLIVEGLFGQMVRQISKSVSDSARPEARIAHLNQFFFDDMGFTVADNETFFSPSNNFVDVAMTEKVGSPATIALIYQELASRLGLKTGAVAWLGLFYIRLMLDNKECWLNTYNGQIVTPVEAEKQIQSLYGKVDKNGLVNPCTSNYWITRIFQNTLGCLARMSSSTVYEQMGAVLELEMILHPTEMKLKRDMILCLSGTRNSHLASKWAKEYVSANPNDPYSQTLQQYI